jgi:2-oxoglutarate ferredoxin oxidoreductase subunit alpha
MAAAKAPQDVSAVTVRFSGDSGDGMQLTGAQFTDTSALMGNDVSTLPEFPAEIRAPVGTLPGVSSFQIQFADTLIYTPGDLADVLVAMNPAALKVDLPNTKKGGLVIVNEDTFTEENLKKAAWASNPLEDRTLVDYQVLKVPLSTLTRNALQDSGLKPMEIDRCKNFFALGFAFWLYDRSLDHTIAWVNDKFAKRPEIAKANVAALKAGYHYADITEAVAFRYRVKAAPIEPGTYRKVTGNEATALGLVAASLIAKKTLFYASYPITPASDILQEIAAMKNYGVKTFQAEDEIAACGAAVGASFAGQIGVTGTSGPGMCLKAEMVGLAVMSELPLVVVDAQRAGPSTGMPTKPEQGDLLMSLYGRHGESPIAVVAPRTPSDCFLMAIEAVRLATKYMTPVIFLSDGYLANSSEPWKLPDLEALPKIEIAHPKPSKEKFLPYARDPETLARPWAVPGTPGLEHRIGGLAKADITGNVSYDPANNQKMVNLRAEKIRRIAREIPPVDVRGPKSGKLLILGWGSTYGTIYQAVSELEREGVRVSQAHLQYLNPFPRNLGEVLEGFEKVLIPELNMGQLLLLVHHHFPSAHAVGLNKVQGQPFKVVEVTSKVRELLAEMTSGQARPNLVR